MLRNFSKIILLLIILINLSSCEKTSEYEFILENKTSHILKIDLVANTVGGYIVFKELVLPEEIITLHRRRHRMNTSAEDYSVDTIPEFEIITIKKADILSVPDTQNIEISIKPREYWNFHQEDNGFLGIYEIKITDEFLDTITY